jgi:hypothetical protein
MYLNVIKKKHFAIIKKIFWITFGTFGKNIGHSAPGF